jgi:hypothetical protein
MASVPSASGISTSRRCFAASGTFPSKAIHRYTPHELGGEQWGIKSWTTALGLKSPPFPKKAGISGLTMALVKSIHSSMVMLLKRDLTLEWKRGNFEDRSLMSSNPYFSSLQNPSSCVVVRSAMLQGCCNTVRGGCKIAGWLHNRCFVGLRTLGINQSQPCGSPQPPYQTALHADTTRHEVDNVLEIPQ